MNEKNNCKHFDKTINLEKNYLEYPLAIAYEGSTPPPSRCFYLCERYRECYCKDHYKNDKVYKVESICKIPGKGTVYVMEEDDDLRFNNKITMENDGKIIKGTVRLIERFYKQCPSNLNSLMGVIIREEK